MSIEPKSWGRSIGGVVGAALAGPPGAILGTVTGAFLQCVLRVPEPLSEVVRDFVALASQTAGARVTRSLTPAEHQVINHDLQTAFRDAFAEALYDVGGERCFPDAWKAPRDVPPPVVFFSTAQGHALSQHDAALPAQVCGCLRGMAHALRAGEVLPLNPPLDQHAADVRPYLAAETPQALADAFYAQVVAPYLASYQSLMGEVPDFQAHLRRHLLDRTLVHLSELLKARTPAWRALNRMVLEELRGGLLELKDEQAQIHQQLDNLLARESGSDLAVWADGMADLVAASSRVERGLDEGFGAVLARVREQHGELLARFDRLTATAGRIEGKVDRVLRILENGSWVVEGAPEVAVDEPAAPGEPPGSTWDEHPGPAPRSRRQPVSPVSIRR